MSVVGCSRLGCDRPESPHFPPRSQHRRLKTTVKSSFRRKTSKGNEKEKKYRTFIDVTQVDDVRLLCGEASGQEAALVEWPAPLEVQRLNPVTSKAVHHVHVGLRVDEEVPVVVNCGKRRSSY